MIITCPYCGARSHSEFTYRGDATAVRPTMDNTSIEDHAAYVFDRKNPAGLHRELWNHTGGCRMHVVVTRDTVTHEVVSCEPIGPFAEQLKKDAEA
ncbi:MAG: sarcosine oxidase subunit delta [Pseudomonadota bacterium]